MVVPPGVAVGRMHKLAVDVDVDIGLAVETRSFFAEKQVEPSLCRGGQRGLALEKLLMAASKAKPCRASPTSSQTQYTTLRKS